MRLLNKSSVLLDLPDLGFSPRDYVLMDSLIRRPDGIILVTGPTGSGKTTTLYACLNRINQPNVNILTAEDPVEYEIGGIHQVHVQPKIGLTFASALRAFLRQDPDVVMVGEIRDKETVEIAINASLTGHLVLSTIHTIDAPESINRMLDFFPPHQHSQVRSMLAGTLRGVISQRLVPAAEGGRVAVCEVLRMTGRARDMILDPTQTGALQAVVAEGGYYGMQTFDQALYAHVVAGRVTVEDAVMVASSPHDFKLLLDSEGRRGTTMADVPLVPSAAEAPPPLTLVS
jgi:pilus retraction protein PilT